VPEVVRVVVMGQMVV